MVPLQPRFMTDVLTCRGEPPQAGVVPLTTKTGKLAHRATIRFKPDRGTPLQRNSLALTIGEELQVNVTHTLRRHQRRSRLHASMLKAVPQIK